MISIARTAAVAAMLAALPAAAAPETYKVDPDHTYPRFSYNHLGFSTQEGRFDKTTGTVMLDREARTGAVDVTIRMEAVSTGSELDAHLRGADFFDVARFPTATFKSTRVAFDGDAPAAIEGDLTIRGVTRPITLKVTAFKTGLHAMHKKDAIGARATGTLRRSEFGAGKYVPMVSDEIGLDITLEAIRQ
jgi:polyisoprenoid-binding protein YceI